MIISPHGGLNSDRVRAALYFSRKRRLFRADPYGNAIVAYSAALTTNYLLNTGRVETLYDLTDNDYDLTQSVSADRPTIGSVALGDALVHTSASEWLENTTDAELYQLMDDASEISLQIDFICELDTAGINQVCFNWGTIGSNDGYAWFGFTSTDAVRVWRRNSVGTQQSVTSAGSLVTTGTTYVFSILYTGGLVTVLQNGSTIISAQDYIGATGDLACDRFSIGNRYLATPSLPFEGKIRELIISPY